LDTGTAPFAELLRRFRDRAELTQEELAERAGISPDAVGLLERGERRRPHTDTVARLAAALELVADERPHFEAAARRQRRSPLKHRRRRCHARRRRYSVAGKPSPPSRVCSASRTCAW